jgi:hypothetical protein
MTNRDGNFGLGYKQLSKKYFKEYNEELKGKESPGPAKYQVTVKDFNIPRNSCKSMPRVMHIFQILILLQERRECPIINKHTINEVVCPQTYDINYINFAK